MMGKISVQVSMGPVVASLLPSHFGSFAQGFGQRAPHFDEVGGDGGSMPPSGIAQSACIPHPEAASG